VTEPKNTPTDSDLIGRQVWVCVHCGAINPSRPSTTCPHYQLAFFTSLDGEEHEAVLRLSKARRELFEELGRFNESLKQFVKAGKAKIEAAPRRRKIDPSKPGQDKEEFALEQPEPRTPSAPRQAPRAGKREPSVDPRQLVLLNFMKQGHA